MPLPIFRTLRHKDMGRRMPDSRHGNPLHVDFQATLLLPPIGGQVQVYPAALRTENQTEPLPGHFLHRQGVAFRPLTCIQDHGIPLYITDGDPFQIGVGIVRQRQGHLHGTARKYYVLGYRKHNPTSTTRHEQGRPYREKHGYARLSIFTHTRFHRPACTISTRYRVTPVDTSIYKRRNCRLLLRLMSHTKVFSRPKGSYT